MAPQSNRWYKWVKFQPQYIDRTGQLEGWRGTHQGVRVMQRQESMGHLHHVPDSRRSFSHQDYYTQHQFHTHGRFRQHVGNDVLKPRLRLFT